MLTGVELRLVAILVNVFVGLASEVWVVKKQCTPLGQHIRYVRPLLHCMLWSCLRCQSGQIKYIFKPL